MNKYATISSEATPIALSFKDKGKQTIKDLLLPFLGNIPFNPKEKALRCIFFHYVFENNVNNFEDIISRLKDLGNFINTDQCCSMVEGKQPIDGSYYHLSFDDGFKNNLFNAAKVLRKLSVPACFFVPTGHIEASYEEVYSQLVETKRYRKPIEMLSWDDCKQLLDWGFDIGSHTRTHARLSGISGNDELLRNEIFGSKEDLESRLGYRCKYISWPYGNLWDINQKAIDYIEKAGYQACFGAFGGRIKASNPNILFQIPRRRLEADWPISHVLAFVRGILEVGR